MSLNLSLDITTATLADLEAFLAAARAASATDDADLVLDGTYLRVDVSSPRAEKPQAENPQATAHPRHSVEQPLGDNAIRSIIDILSERLDPPRGGSSFGTFGPSI
ncbi:TPA: hypothetical protein I8V98_000774 [Corynebacterium striatum]|uniref:hypothetical protein n=1 Tax=Corynebacterium striatum TaxID=43770 RepID=UPI001A2AFFE8|nr:hypothetical protein [Corynebacterium striatum]HAT1391063.1 hypothetical protein [Corynebacterium striatum]